MIVSSTSAELPRPAPDSATSHVRQVAAFRSPSLSARRHRAAHVNGSPGGAAQLTRLVRQVAPCRSHHTCVVTTLGRTPGMTWFVTSPAGTSTNQDERRVSCTTPVSGVPTVKAFGKTARSSETPLPEVVERFRGTPNILSRDATGGYARWEARAVGARSDHWIC